MTYDYNERKPEFISEEDLNDREKFLLMESNTFCMLPWSHLHAYPNGAAYPCCLSDQHTKLGLSLIHISEPTRPY